MSLMWVSVTECSQSHIYHLTQMIKEDEDLQIILSSGTPYMDDRGDGGLLKKDLERMMSLLDGVTKRLYPDIARMYQASAETVEHAIRHAIEAAWQRGDERTQKKLFGYSHMEGRRPTNSEFITRLADYFSDMSGKYLS